MILASVFRTFRDSAAIFHYKPGNCSPLASRLNSTTRRRCWLICRATRTGRHLQPPADCAGRARCTFRFKNYRRDGAERYSTMTLARWLRAGEFIRRFCCKSCRAGSTASAITACSPAPAVATTLRAPAQQHDKTARHHRGGGSGDPSRAWRQRHPDFYQRDAAANSPGRSRSRYSHHRRAGENRWTPPDTARTPGPGLRPDHCGGSLTRSCRLLAGNATHVRPPSAAGRNRCGLGAPRAEDEDLRLVRRFGVSVRRETRCVILWREYAV